MKMKGVEEWIVDWADEKGFFTKSCARVQLEKMKEEVNEYETELIKLDTKEILDAPIEDKNEILEKAKMELGDIFVTAIVQAKFLNTTPEKVMWMAYNKINARKGKLINGIFVRNKGEA